MEGQPNQDNDHFSYVVEKRITKVTQSKDSKDVSLKTDVLIFSNAHKNIRGRESNQFIHWIRMHSVILIDQKIGLGGEYFLSSILHGNPELFNDYDIYKVDLDGVNTIDGLNERFILSTGVSVEVFIVICSNKKYGSLLFMDNISFLNDDKWRGDFSRVINTLQQIGGNVLIVPCGNIQIDSLGYNKIELSTLDESEAKCYIRDHVFGKESLLGKDIFYSLLRLSSGNPIKLDQLLDRLRFHSLDEITKQEFQQVSAGGDNNKSITQHFEYLIKDIIDSKNDFDSDSLKILKCLCFLTLGETIRNINRINPKVKNLAGILSRLTLDGIVNVKKETPIFLSSSEDEVNIFELNALIATHIKAVITPNNANQILKTCIDFYFGKDWFSGKPKLNKESKEIFRFNYVGAQSNAHVVLMLFINLNIGLGVKLNNDTLRVVKVALYYSRVLYNHSRYRDAIIFCEELITLLQGYEEVPINRLYFVLSESYRMVSDREEAVLNMEKVLEDVKGLDTSEIADAHLELALAYYKIGNFPKAQVHAKKAIVLSPKGSALSLQCQAILASELVDSECKKKLYRIEKKARRQKYTWVAYNILLTFADQEDLNENKIKLYDKVIETSSRGYNHIRATIYKAHTLMEMNKLHLLSPTEKIYLYDLYGYLFTQRIQSMFIKLHGVLWTMFKRDGNVSSLASLLRYSSTIWRIEGDVKNEIKYLKDCRGFLGDKTSINNTLIVTDYIDARLEDLESLDNV